MSKSIACVAALGVVLCHGVASAEQSARERADALFEQGVARFREGDFAGALERFQGSYDASPTPALRYNIGVCQYNLEQWEAARRELSAYLAETDPSLVTAERREQVEGLLAEIDGRIGPAPDRTPAPSPPPPPPRPPATPEPGTVGEAPEQPSDLQPPASGLQPETRHRISRAWFWVTAGLAVALAVGGGVTGGLVLGAESDFDALVEECNSGTRQGCTDDGVDIRDRADALVAATNALFAVAGASALAALVLAFFTEWGGGDRQETAGWRLEVGASPSGPLVDVSLRF
jgi:tetratricopeptide (TPR) repeat protein